MNILVLGAGALGSLLGAHLATQDHTILLSRNKDHIKTIQEHGLIIEEINGRSSRFQLPAFYNPDQIPYAPDLVLISVKTYDTKQAISSIYNLCHPSTLFLTLQNGIGNWEQIAQQGVARNNILAGTTAQGATMLKVGHIKHGGDGPTYIGKVEGDLDERVYKVVNIFQKAGLQIWATENVHLFIWEKLLINIGINAITALTGVRNGWIIECSQAKELATAALQEALNIAKAKGINISENIVQRLFEVAQNTSQNISSMNQDIQNKKLTEIDAINGAIVKFGKEMNIPTPINWTLTNLIHIVQEKNLKEKSNE